MKSINYFIIVLIILFSCNSNQRENKNITEAERIDASGDESNSGGGGMLLKSESVADTSISANAGNDQFISSDAAVEDGRDSVRKFIRTANMRFRVRNVLNSTLEIENITNRFGGFVSSTELYRHDEGKSIVAVSEDSSLETTYFTVGNDLIIRVPNTKLDTVLKSVSVLIDFLDHRIIKAEDVALMILRNKLAQERAAKGEDRLTAKSRNAPGKQTIQVEDRISGMQERADEAKIANLSLKDRIAFSTINLSIYQRQSVKREMIPNEKNIDAFKPGIGSRLLNAMKSGWNVLETIIIFLVQLWGIILLGICIYLGYRIFSSRRN